jgi:large subunit ribosomal protein L10
MAKSLQRKQVELTKLEDKLPKAQSFIFVDYTGLTVGEATKIRKQSKAVGAEYIVTKKSLMKKAVEKAGVKGFEADSLTGNVAVILGYNDPISPAKVANDFAKTSEHLKILSGVMDLNFINKAVVMQLASLPSKQELLQKLVGTLNAPIASFVRALNSIAEKAA